MWTAKAHEPRPKDASDGSRCCIRWRWWYRNELEEGIHHLSKGWTPLSVSSPIYSFFTYFEHVDSKSSRITTQGRFRWFTMLYSVAMMVSEWIRRRHTSSKQGMDTTFCFLTHIFVFNLFWTCGQQKLTNHDPRTLQMVHDVVLGGDDGIGMN